MNLFSFLLVIAGLAESGEAYSREIPPKAMAAYATAFPDRSLHGNNVAFGDVVGDASPDFVAFRGDPKYNERGVENLRIALFIGMADGSFSLHSMSADILGHERVSHHLSIERRSLFLHRDGSGGCCSHWIETFQFETRDNELHLIGLKTSDITSDEPTDSSGISANLITGELLTWRGGATGRTESRKHFLAPKLIALREFDYDVFTSDWSSLLESLRD